MIEINGNAEATKIKAMLAPRVAALPFTGVFCDLLVGDDPRSELYVKMKGLAAEEIGFRFRKAHFPESVDTETLIRTLQEFSAEQNMCGIIVQLPLPAHINKQAVLDSISPAVDVDALGKENTKLFYDGQALFIPPTAAAILHLADTVPIDWPSSKILVIGQGELVGKPVTYLFRKRGYTVMTSDKHTPKDVLAENIATADVIVSGTGQLNLITGSMVKKGVVILDAGTVTTAGLSRGDIDRESVADKASYLSPVPGGIGPVTVAMLLRNVVEAAERKAGLTS